MKAFIVIVSMLLSSPCFATDWYVDKDATGTGNGTSWTNAWTTPSAVTGVSGGDTVYISGGATSKTYEVHTGTPIVWQPKGGTANNPVVYKVGQTAGHNGTVIFDGGCSSEPCAANTGEWVYPDQSWFTIDGEVNGTSHMTVQNALKHEYVYATNKQGLVFKYINFATPNDAFRLDFDAGTTGYYEIAYCTMHATKDHAIVLNDNSTPAGWDTNKIHHNTFVLDYEDDASGFGADGIRWGNSVSIYNNTFTGNKVSNEVPQHADALQANGRYTKFYNNVLRDLGNYGVFIEGIWNPTQDIRVYNNVILLSDPQWIGGYQQGISIGRSGDATGDVYFYNIIVANNTIINYKTTTQQAISLGPPGNAQSFWDSSDIAYNNISYDSVAAAAINMMTTITGYGHASNSVVSGANTHFAAYTALGGSSLAATYDLHLLASDTAFKDQGVSSVSSYFNTDIIGTLRPRGSAYDIGAYEYDPGNVIPPDATAPTITAFVIPSTASSLTVAISSFTATDNTAVTGYCIAETNSSSGCSWSATAQTSHVFASDGAHTLYAFAKDAAGNVSVSANGSVTITIPVAPDRPTAIRVQ